MVAAILAADRGCHVALIERTKELGGSAVSSSEEIAAAGTSFQRDAGIDDRPESLAADIVGNGSDPGDRALAEAIAGQAATAVEWLVSRCGAPVALLPAERGGHSAPRLHVFGRNGGAELVPALVRVVTRHHRIKPRLGAEVTEMLRAEDGHVTGVALKPDRRSSPVIDGRLLLATGGFVADDALVGEHAPDTAALPFLGHAHATGDALRYGLAAGAGTRRLAVCRVTPLLALPGHLDVPAAIVALGGILVNQAGARFVNEGEPALAVAQAIRAQPGQMAYLVFDERIASTVVATDPFFEHVVLPRAGRRGGTLADLAKQFEINAEGLTATIAGIGTGSDAFGRTIAGPALAEPFHAVRVTGARRRTLGGLTVDASARVLGADGSPVSSLYAVGGAAAGPRDEATAGPLRGLDTLLAVALGRLAALDVVRAVAESEPDAPAGD